MNDSLAVIEAWLRGGIDSLGRDRWICAPDGCNGPIVARHYGSDPDHEAPTLEALADLLRGKSDGA